MPRATIAENIRISLSRLQIAKISCDMVAPGIPIGNLK
jgi:hypothetical protein